MEVNCSTLESTGALAWSDTGVQGQAFEHQDRAHKLGPELGDAGVGTGILFTHRLVQSAPKMNESNFGQTR